MKTIEQQKRQRKKQLTIQYMTAVGLIFLVSLSSLLILRHILKQQEGYATIINISGRQRMLSQQIALLAHEILAKEQQGERKVLLGQINVSIQLMKQSHQQLTSGKTADNTGVELSDILSDMYFSSPLEVDRLVNDYLANIERLVAEPVSEKSFRELSVLAITARGVLLNALNDIVQQYERESNTYSDALADSALLIFILMLLLLAVIVVFAFRPMANVVAENEGMLNSILDSIPTLMDIVSKKDGTILYQSEFLLNRLGESSIGQKCFEAYKVDQIPCESCPTSHAEVNVERKVTTCFDRLGVGTIIQITHLPILFKGEEALLHTFQDITEQQNTEAFLIKAKEEADQTSNLKSNFLANMSHEIKTPMNAIIGFSDLALETELNPQQQGYLNKIRHSSQSLLKIVNTILDFSKIATGNMNLENREFSVEEIWESLRLLYGDDAQEKNIELCFREEAGTPVLLIGDAPRLQQILSNLIENSLKFTDQGKITVTANLMERTAQQVQLVFNVADTGIGMTSAEQLTLFDSFAQVDSSTTRKYGGTGLGLAISKQLVELLGGVLEVSSEEGVGTVLSFTVIFKLQTGDSKSLEEKSSMPEGGQESKQNHERRKNSRDRRKPAEGPYLSENSAYLDMEQGLARLEGNHDLYLRLLQEFAAETASVEQKIVEALNKKDQESAERLVHTVKGMAGSLCAAELAAKSFALEKVLKAGGKIEIELAQFAEALQQVLHFITALAEKRQNNLEAVEKSCPVDKEKSIELLAELIAMLSNKDFQSGNKWNELRPLLPMLTERQIQRIDRSINSFDFEHALEILSEMNIQQPDSIEEKESSSHV